MCICILAYFNKKNKHEQKCAVVVVRFAGLSTKQQQGFTRTVFTPLVDVDGMKKFIIIYIIIIIMWLLCYWPVSVSLLYKTVQKSSPVYLKQWALSGARTCLRDSQWLFTRLFSFQFNLLRGSSPWHRPPVCRLSAQASHDAGLDVLVGDLLVVVVRTAARWVHRWGRHGVEREDELLSVTHAGRLGMVPRNTCKKKKRYFKHNTNVSVSVKTD